MTSFVIEEMDSFESIVDFLRYGLSCTNQAELYYGHGSDNAWDDLLALILDSLSLPFDVNPVLLSARLTETEKATLKKRLARRILERVPVPYLTQQAWFCGLPFYVDERVLIPRSPVAELIEQQFTPWIEADQVTRVLDMCTGSACIAIACCYALPEASVDAVDISPEALTVAKINQEMHGLNDALTLIQSNCFDAVPERQYDIIVSNPPYVNVSEMKTLPREYGHEPVLALEAEENGLAIVEKILGSAHAYLSDRGILVVEVGNSEKALVKKYPDVEFTWLDFERGGKGVFLLTREQLVMHWGPNR